MWLLYQNYNHAVQCSRHQNCILSHLTPKEEKKKGLDTICNKFQRHELDKLWWEYALSNQPSETDCSNSHKLHMRAMRTCEKDALLHYVCTLDHFLPSLFLVTMWKFITCKSRKISNSALSGEHQLFTVIDK